jgi:hypothetical protein
MAEEDLRLLAGEQLGDGEYLELGELVGLLPLPARRGER